MKKILTTLALSMLVISLWTPFQSVSAADAAPKRVYITGGTTDSPGGPGGTGNSGTTNTNANLTPCGSACNMGYTPLEPIPGITSGPGGTYDLTTPGGFSKLINALFKILISVGALIAVLSLTIGGIQYMTSSSVGTKTSGIDRAKASLWGILLIAGIWLILNTINPELLNFNFNPCPVGSSTCSSIGSAFGSSNALPVAPLPNVGSMTPEQIQAAQNNGSIGALANVSNNTFTFTNGSAGNNDLNAQFATWSSACTAAHGSVQSGPQVDNGGTLTMVCAQQ